MPTSLASAYRKLTQAELMTEARERFGPDPMSFAFQCPQCDDIATIAEFAKAGDPNVAGQECIGRILGATAKPKPTNTRGCDWAAYGLFRGPWEIVMPAEGDKPERSAWSFPLAPAPEPPARLTKGDTFRWAGAAVRVTRVARDHSWADLACDDGQRSWTKRQPLPLLTVAAVLES